MKKLLLLTLLPALLLGCAKTPNEPQTNDKTLKIGVLQFGSHPSLDNCYTGILKGLEESGLNYEVDFKNSNFDSATGDSIAKTFVSKNYDVIIPIATPSAISAYAASIDTQTPVVFTAISDPVSAGLVESLDAPNTNATGSSSVLDHKAQLELILGLQPNVKNIGVLYTTSEANSVSDLKNLKEEAKNFGVNIIEQGVQTSADIPQAAASLVTKVDAISNLTDNNVVNNLSTVIEIATKAGIPVYGSEEEQVGNGALAAQGIDYINLGYETAKMAVDVLKGADISTYPVKLIKDATPFINISVLESFNLTVPEQYSNATFLGDK